MAQLRRQLQGDFQTILAELEDKILGGSNAVLFKINTVGEDAFLAQIEQIVDRYSI